MVRLLIDMTDMANESQLREMVSESLNYGAQLNMKTFDECTDEIVAAALAISVALNKGGKIVLFGNGGSAADAQHIAAEFVGRFVRERGPWPAMALTTDTSILTAIGNDYGFEHVYSRQLNALSASDDVAIAISTSGRSVNIVEGVRAARAAGATTVGLLGGDGGQVAPLVDIAIIVPSTITQRIQECHIAIGHIICELIEELRNDCIS